MDLCNVRFGAGVPAGGLFPRASGPSRRPVLHRAAVDAAAGHAAAGGDIVVMATTPENASSHAVFEAKVAERLTAEAKAVIRGCGEFAATVGPCAPGETLQDGQTKEPFKA